MKRNLISSHVRHISDKIHTSEHATFTESLKSPPVSSNPTVKVIAEILRIKHKSVVEPIFTPEIPKQPEEVILTPAIAIIPRQTTVSEALENKPIVPIVGIVAQEEILVNNREALRDEQERLTEEKEGLRRERESLRTEQERFILEQRQILEELRFTMSQNQEIIQQERQILERQREELRISQLELTQEQNRIISLINAVDQLSIGGDSGSYKEVEELLSENEQFDNSADFIDFQERELSKEEVLPESHDPATLVNHSEPPLAQPNPIEIPAVEEDPILTEYLGDMQNTIDALIGNLVPLNIHPNLAPEDDYAEEEEKKSAKSYSTGDSYDFLESSDTTEDYVDVLLSGYESDN